MRGISRTSQAWRKNTASATSFTTRTSPTRIGCDALLSRHQFFAVVNFAAESHVDRSIDSPGRFHSHECRRHGHAPRRGAQARRAALPAGLDGRGLRFARTDGQVHREVRDQAKFALLREQGVRRSARAGVPSHLRTGGHGHALLEQLRTISVPREADSADDRQRTGRQTAAGLWRRAERARLDSGRGPLRRRFRGAAARQTRRGL